MKKRPERVIQMLGKSVPMDYFLYSCLERERMTKHSGPMEPGLEHWPVVGSAIAGGKRATSLPNELAGYDLPQLIGELNNWYHKRHPELAQSRQLTYEIIQEIIYPFVMYTHDLATLVFLKTGQQLPPHNSDEPTSKEFWDMLRKDLHKNFPEYAPYFQRYLEWAFAAEIVEKWELGSRPPVGRYAPSLRLRGIAPRGGGDRGPPRSGGGDRGGPRGGSDRPPRGDKPQRDSRPPREDREPTKPSANSERGGGPDRERGGGGRDRNGPSSRSPEKSQELESAAMADVNEAIERLKNSPDLAEISLKPANSYYRRLQHQHAVDLGFETNSVGEGNDRTVKISRT